MSDTTLEIDHDQRAEAQHDAQLIEDLMDRVEGLQADLDAAIEVAVARGAVEWAKLNYPSHPALRAAGPHMEAPTAAAISALTRVRDTHLQAAKAARKHLQNGCATPGVFVDMTSEEVAAIGAFHCQEAESIQDLIENYLPEAQTALRQKQMTALRKVAEAERAACLAAVAKTSAPIAGTPYAAGARAFCDAIRSLPPVDAISLTQHEGQQDGMTG
jgi:hypothetical protein